MGSSGKTYYSWCFQPPRVTSSNSDHSIPIKNGTNPVNVYPYQYAHYQKNEIEILIEEMLIVGIIRPRSCLYSSPGYIEEEKKWE